MVYTIIALNRATEVTLSVLFPVVETSTSPTLLLGFIVDPSLAKMELNLSSSSSSGKNVRVMLSMNQSKSNDLKNDHDQQTRRTDIQQADEVQSATPST